MRSLDLALILAYLVGITWFGTRFKSSQKSLRDYFLGGKKVPWWAIALSIVSAETSTLTIIGTPALAFNGNLGFLQLVLGYLLARVLISILFLPHYFRGELYTAYELMERRFGYRIRNLTSATFLITRALAEGVRVFAISIVVSVILNDFLTRAAGTILPDAAAAGAEVLSIVLITCLTVIYTLEGGMTAVIWTEVIQMVLYVAGAVTSLIVMLTLVPGGWDFVWSAAQEAGKTQIFDFQFSLSSQFFATTYTFWAGLLGGCFLATATHGTEQLMVQRLLAARNETESRIALLSSWILIAIQFSLFLTIGLILWVFYRQRALDPPAIMDRLYPDFIWTYLPVGLAGLVMAAILAASMANIAAALNALSSASIMDVIKPFEERRGKARPDLAYVRLARWATLFWGVVLLAIAIMARRWGSVLEAGLAIASIPFGALLGVFLLGVLTRRVGEGAAMAAMVTGLGAMVYVRFFTTVAWTWYAVIGTTVTFTAGLLYSRLSPVPSSEIHGKQTV